MLYTKWNYIISTYLFNKESADQDVLLCMSIDDVVNAYRKQKKVSITQNRDSIINDESDEMIWEDFKTAIRHGISKENTLLKNLAQCYYLTINNIDKYNGNDLYMENEERFPLYISYLVIFVMPLVEGIEQFDYRGYYEIPNKFFQKNKLFGKSETKLQFSKSIIIQVESVKNGVLNKRDNEIYFEDIWMHLAQWSKDKNYSLGRYLRKPFDNEKWKYVGFPMAECVVLPKQHNKLRMLFEKADLPVNEIISKKTTEELLQKFGLQIIYNNDNKKWKFAWDNFRDVLINVFIEEYNRWDGNSRIVNKIIRGEKETNELIDSGRTFNLYLTLIANRFGNGYDLGLEVWTPNSGEAPDELNFKFNDQIFNLKINSTGWGTMPIQLNNLMEYLGNREKVIIKDEIHSIKAILQPSDIYLFHKISPNKYVSRSVFQKGESYILLILEELIDNSFTRWLEDNEVKEIISNTPEGYRFFKIEEAITDFVGIAKLMSARDCKIIEIANILIYNDNSKTIFSNLFDIYFLIEGINSKQSNVFAKFEDNNITSIKLTYDEIRQLWKLKINDFSNIFKCNQPFKIIVNKIDESENDTYLKVVESTKKYEISKHKLPSSYKQSTRNYFGLYDEVGSFKGLSLPIQKSQAVLISDLKNDTFKYGAVDYCKSDFVLYALSSRQVLDKQAFREVLNAISTSIDYQNPIYHDRILNDYDRMGYLNYDYYNNKHIITVNKPTIALLPLKFECKNIGLRVKECSDSYYKAIIVGARTKEFVDQLEKSSKGFCIKISFEDIRDPFLPQTIVLHSKDKLNFEKLARSIKCDYSNTDYSYNLLYQIANVDDFKNSIPNYIITKGEYPADYTQYKSFECLDYNTLENKAKYCSDLDLVTYNPRTRYQRTILWKDGSQFEVDKYWGHFFMMSELKIQKVKFDNINKVIKIPKTIKFPKIYERVLMMMTERPPWYESEYKCYFIPDNLYATINTSSQATDILKKLNQL
jgi:hypothetical protein